MVTTIDRTGGPRTHTARVHVIDDDAAVLALISRVVESAGLEAVPHLHGREFLTALEPDEYACAVLDLMMPDLPGLSVLHELHDKHPTIPVIIVSGRGDVATALETVRGGAVDFIEKPFRADQLIARVKKALEIASALRARATRAQEIQRRIATLTPREAELMPLLCHGASVKRIAFELGLSFKTVQVHRSNILKRMQVTSVVDLTNLLYELETPPSNN